MLIRNENVMKYVENIPICIQLCQMISESTSLTLLFSGDVETNHAVLYVAYVYLAYTYYLKKYITLRQE